MTRQSWNIKAEGALHTELVNEILNLLAGKRRTVGLEEFAKKMLVLPMPRWLALARSRKAWADTC
jgi:hypothetical protein